ncbi:MULTISPECIES: SF1B family DNA helicase RecD2 [Oceanobacillus]|uniref:ATP-dependent RecD2 DNA helicase n=1 Tax=Oceanobacillus indicireducens TaxID=1004261 RepID=A0A917XWT2_9BACI|nr:ATP-dependent RecD-like DNA helicase [Oceanobacillus indicireducens]GGN55125.1 ATP-dependent RecD-like DNA helicase [Oceanobacillus indicireducens]
MEDKQRNEKGYIRGRLLYTIFHNEDENFAIIKVKIEDTNEDYEEKEIVAKGYFSHLTEEHSYYFHGVFEQHQKFGIQYRVESYQTYIPDTKEGLISYLSSDLFYAIGEKTATRIVDKLGMNAISHILEDPECLDGIPGLKKQTREQLHKSLEEHQGFERVAITLSSYQISLKMAQRIYQRYKEEAIHKLYDDPYQFVFDIEGFGFQSADQIARMNGLSMDHPNRIGAGCIFVLQKSIQDGHVYLPYDQCVREMIQVLGFELTEQIIQERLEQLNTEKKIIISEGNIYLPSLYYAEDGFAAHISRIMNKKIESETTLAELMKITGEIEEEEILSYGKEQFDAIEKALQSKVMILTGGPGTGKTTVIKGIVKAYATIHDHSLDIDDYEKKSDFPFVLTAPTGRAAKRLKESTGLPSSTIHRLLGWDGKDGFEKNEQERLSGKFLIVDEFSMVDTWLANHLFKAIPDDMQVLLVGDEDQLPSVGPGQVLSDLLSSGKIPIVRLHEVYRQKEGSKIIELAHEIKNNEITDASLQKANDFSFIPASNRQIVEAITIIFKHALEKGIDTNAIQVLAPIYKTEAGINRINEEIQQLLNPKTDKTREMKVMDVSYRVGDRVIQLVNQPEDGVFNGDIGEIVAIFFAKENKEKKEQIVIAFEEKEIVYERQDFGNFMHAYCISIHKSQGSEFPIIILPVISSYHRMLRKNLLYTAITRSKESLIICGDMSAFLRGVTTMDTNQRYTSLIERLESRLEEEQELPNFISDEEKELNPYDFM